MAETYSAKLQDKEGNALLPRTRSTLVECDDGRSVEAALQDKQDTLTAGDNITISDGVISSSSAVKSVNGLKGAVSIVEAMQFNINDEGHLILTYPDTGSVKATDFTINSEGHLILTVND